MKLWHNTVTGEPSTAKLWRQIAYIVATWVIYKNADGISWELLISYLAIVSGSELGQKIVEAKFYGRGSNQWNSRDREFPAGRVDNVDLDERSLPVEANENRSRSRSGKGRS